MNATTLLVGLASGAASAALSTALASGSTFALFLFCFAPLPVFIAALGWRHHAGLIASVVATAILYALIGFDTARSYALSVGFPSWWLAYLALLGRPVDPENPERGLTWYPVGRIVTWSAVIACALVLASILMYGGSVEDYRAMLRSTFEEFLRAQTGAPADAPVTLPNGEDAGPMAEVVAVILPPFAAAMWATLALVNLWVAGRVVRTSGRLARPWPDLSAFNLPALALFALVGGILGSALPGLPGFASGVVGAAFVVVFAALGLALLHTGTRGTAGRTVMLGATYVLMVFQPWIVLIVATLGVVEFLFGLRARIAAGRGPGHPPQST